MSALWLRSLAAFLVLPGVVAGVIPFLIRRLDPWSMGNGSPGSAIALIGGIILLACVRDFYVSGRGTLAPWDPPRSLVVVGLYRYTRNPMYWGVGLLVLGQALLAGSPLMLGYAVFLGIAFHLRVVLKEEPFLASRFGQEWEAYRRAVPRWWWSMRGAAVDPPDG